MNQSQYNQLFSFIWNIATDVLVYAFEKGEYKKIIMPMMVLRRIDVLLEISGNLGNSQDIIYPIDKLMPMR